MAAFRNTSAALAAVTIASSLVVSVHAHSFLSHPSTISTLDGCRIGGTGGYIGNCPGPCPNYNIAADADPTNPAAIYKRGSHNRVVWTRNNHEGGFTRWTIVPIDKMWDKAMHDKMAFEYTCWNIGRFNCNEFDYHRDCNYDEQNEAFSKMLYIPPIYPDGDYVLGFTWYGGGVGFGHFGDYYDCSYIRIEGGEPVQPSWQPTFHGGGGSMYEDGCEATVDSLGQCWKEPCIPIRKTKKLVPMQFKTGAQPEPILSSWYKGGLSHHSPTISIKRLHLVDANRDYVLDTDLAQIINLHRSDEISLFAETTGNVAFVEWFTNGRQKGQDYDMPFTIAGDFRGDFYPWMHPVFNRRIRVAIKAMGNDGTFTWLTLELRFHEVNNGGVSTYRGVSFDDFMNNNGHANVQHAWQTPGPAPSGSFNDVPKHITAFSGRRGSVSVSTVGSKRSGGLSRLTPEVGDRADVAEDAMKPQIFD